MLAKLLILQIYMHYARWITVMDWQLTAKSHKQNRNLHLESKIGEIMTGNSLNSAAYQRMSNSAQHF